MTEHAMEAPPAAPRESPRSRADRAALLGLCLLLLLVTLTYARVVDYGFIWDDFLYVVRNPVVADGITPEGIWWALTSTEASNYWHPLTWFSHMLDTDLFGTGPAGPHIVNVVWHLAGTALLFFVLRGLTGAPLRSLAVAAVYSLHPLRVESVAWISERKDILGAFFWMATVGAWASYTRRPAGWRYAAAVCFLVLGLASKPTLVALPLILLLLDWWPLGRLGLGWRRLLLEKAPLAAIAAVAGVTAYLSQLKGGVLAVKLPLAERVGNSIVSAAEYLVKTVWPVRLAVLYPIAERTLTPALVGGSALLVVGLTVLVVRERDRRPYLLAGWTWYLVALAPVLGIVQVGEHLIADRYTYLPHVGLFIALVWLVGDLARSRPGAARGILAAAGVALVALASVAWRQVGFWKDEETLYRHTLEIAPDNRIIHYNLSLVLANRGAIPEAEEHLREAVRLREDYAEAHNNLGNVLRLKGDREGAEREYRAAIRFRPGLAEAWDNLGMLLLDGGDRPGAAAAFTQAVRLSPDTVRYRENLDRAGAASGAAVQPDGR